MLMTKKILKYYDICLWATIFPWYDVLYAHVFVVLR